MAEIINPKIVNSKEKAVEAAQKIIESQRTQTEQKKFEFEKFINALQEVNPEMGGFDELGAMLALPEEQFAILAPVFLAELDRGMHNVNDQMIMVQSMNMLGMKAENVREQYDAIYKEIDEQMGDVLSHQKRDFLKQMLGMTYNENRLHTRKINSIRLKSWSKRWRIRLKRLERLQKISTSP